MQCNGRGWGGQGPRMTSKGGLPCNAMNSYAEQPCGVESMRTNIAYVTKNCSLGNQSHIQPNDNVTTSRSHVQSPSHARSRRPQGNGRGWRRGVSAHGIVWQSDICLIALTGKLRRSGIKSPASTSCCNTPTSPLSPCPLRPVVHGKPCDAWPHRSSL